MNLRRVYGAISKCQYVTIRALISFNAVQALDTVEMPSFRPMMLSLARITSLVVWDKPHTMQSTSPVASSFRAKYIASRAMRFNAEDGKLL